MTAPLVPLWINFKAMHVVYSLFCCPRRWASMKKIKDFAELIAPFGLVFAAFAAQVGVILYHSPF